MKLKKGDSFPLLPYLTLRFEQKKFPEGDLKSFPKKFFFSFFLLHLFQSQRALETSAQKWRILKLPVEDRKNVIIFNLNVLWILGGWPFGQLLNLEKADLLRWRFWNIELKEQGHETHNSYVLNNPFCRNRFYLWNKFGWLFG